MLFEPVWSLIGWFFLSGVTRRTDILPSIGSFRVCGSSVKQEGHVEQHSWEDEDLQLKLFPQHCNNNMLFYPVLDGKEYSQCGRKTKNFHLYSRPCHGC